MSWALWVPLATSALLGATAGPVGRRLPPATAVRVLTAGALITALATGFVLTAVAVLVIGQAPPVAALGEWSGAALASGDPVPLAAGCLAALAVTVLGIAAFRRAVRTGRELRLAARVCRSLGPSVTGLVVVDDDAPEAYALPGIALPGIARPGISGRVVVSSAMLRALPADERRVLLAHEAAHLRHRHHLYVQLAELAAAADPLLRPAANAVRRGVERWADEVAAEQVGDRRLAARALARAGLARAAAGRLMPEPAIALPGVGGDLVERTQALLAPAARRRPVLAGAVAALILLTTAAGTVAAGGTEDRFETAQTAYAATR
jgi:Zn-dependent protease with chaperone function